ncbi:hypothetical protein SHV74_25410 [Pseudomonas capeferrum]|uniref:hypothetical protein n=1 Tax=Pseudomonas capeferrum TaxID=1495066 RepID=UPI003977E9C7
MLPHIPLLRDANIDVVELNGGALETWINPGMSAGDPITLNWRGCTADGDVVDLLGLECPQDVDPVRGGKVTIPNGVLVRLSGGYVFYSYAPGMRVGPDTESLRLFFSVDGVANTGYSLGVAQIAQSHDLVLEIGKLNEAQTVTIPPYESMSVDDELVLTWQAYSRDFPDQPYKGRHPVGAHDIGHPISMQLPVEYVWDLQEGDYGDLHYVIAYSNGSTSESPTQRFVVQSFASPERLLEAPQIPGYDGNGYLNPDDYREGVPLVIAPYPGMQAGDQIVVSINGRDRTVRGVRMDMSNIDSQRLLVLLEPGWLSEERFGQAFEIYYQYSRHRQARRSLPLQLTVRRPLYLPWPIIENAVPDVGDDPNQATLHPRDALWGAHVRIPADAETAGAVVKMHWDGHASTGSIIIDTPSAGDPRRYPVPVSAIPANIGKRLRVYYTVTPPGEQAYPSAAFDLRVDDYAQQVYPLISGRDIKNSELSLADVQGDSSPFTLASWPFMAEGQLLRIQALGRRGPNDEVSIWLRDNLPVSEEEYYVSEIHAQLPKSWLESLQLGQVFLITVAASFDDGESYKPFRSVSARLVH